MSSKVLNVGEDDFDRIVLQSQTPVLVHFWADWCGPCKMIASALEELVHIYDPRLLIAKVNIDHNRRLSGRYHVFSVPFLIVFNHGQIQTIRPGVVCLGQMRSIIQKTLAAAA